MWRGGKWARHWSGIAVRRWVGALRRASHKRGMRRCRKHDFFHLMSVSCAIGSAALRGKGIRRWEEEKGGPGGGDGGGRWLVSRLALH